MPSILFVHTNFPAQFGAFGMWLAGQGWEVCFATSNTEVSAPPDCGMFHFAAREDQCEAVHPHARDLDQALHTASGFARSAEAARADGLMPDIVVAHSGWGAGTYARAVWPETRLIAYVEWWYTHPSPDVTPEEPELERDMVLRAKALSDNASVLLDLAEADGVLCPTQFQAARFPDWIRARLTVLHDGIDTDRHAPDPRARARLALLGVPDDAEVVTYATRGMEPYRGFPDFMRALAVLLAERPTLHAVIVGEDRVAYGRKLPEGESWKTRMLAELDLDLSRVHFTGPLSRHEYITVLQASDAHVYLTIPFVLSWSFIEAMSIGCPMVASDCAPVREAASGSAVQMVEHADRAALVGAISAMLEGPSTARQQAEASRRHAIANFSQEQLWSQRLAFLEQRLATWASPGTVH